VQARPTSKRLASNSSFAVANDALQLLGGYGYLSNYGMEKIVGDLRVHQILEGTNEIMRLVTARHLIAPAPPGPAATGRASTIGTVTLGAA
jgi:hypothetical protein